MTSDVASGDGARDAIIDFGRTMGDGALTLIVGICIIRRGQGTGRIVGIL